MAKGEIIHYEQYLVCYNVSPIICDIFVKRLLYVGKDQDVDGIFSRPCYFFTLQ